MSIVRLTATLLLCSQSPTQAQPLPRTQLPGVAPQLRLERRAFISGHDLEFGRIDAIVADRNGSIHVLDGQTQEIIVLDASGRRVRTIGRKGQGPGEFTGLNGLGFRGDTLVTTDYRLRRATLFSPTGAVLATVALPASLGRVQRLFAGGTDLFGLVWIAKPSVEISPGVHRAPPPDLRYVHFGVDRTPAALSALRDTVHEPTGFNCEAPNGVIAIFDPLFGRIGPLRAFLPTGSIAMAEHGQFRIDIVNPKTGRTERVIERVYAPLPVRNADWDSLTRGYREAEQRSGKLKCDINSMRPATMPSLRTLVSDERGQLWVESWSRSGFNVSVIDAQGRLVGEAPMPGRDPRIAPFVRNNLLYIVTKDSDDVQSIAVYALTR